MTNQPMSKQARVGLLLAAVRRRQRQAVEARVGHLGLSSQQFWVLEAVSQRGDCALADILATLPMDQPTTSRVIAALRERRLLETGSDSTDRRRRCVRLTAQGKRLAEHCTTVARQIRKALLVGLTQADIAMLTDCLARMVANLDRLDQIAPPNLLKTQGRALAKTLVGGSYQARS